MKIHRLYYIVLGLGLTLFAPSCTDRFEEEENNEPAWLGPNVYDYLEQRGDCRYFCQLIRDCGYYESMKRTGSNTRPTPKLPYAQIVDIRRIILERNIHLNDFAKAGTGPDKRRRP
jgi:hypothetical protein